MNDNYIESQMQLIADELNLKAHYARNVIFVTTVKSSWQIYFRCKEERIIVDKLLHSNSYGIQSTGKRKVEYNYHAQEINSGCELRPVMEYIATHDRMKKGWEKRRWNQTRQKGTKKVSSR